jgi:hypothetical protein
VRNALSECIALLSPIESYFWIARDSPALSVGPCIRAVLDFVGNPVDLDYGNQNPSQEGQLRRAT